LPLRFALQIPLKQQSQHKREVRGLSFMLAKDCDFNKKTRIVTFRNAEDFLLLLNSSKEVSFDEIHRAFQFQK
jgi:hypothetical protein